MHTKQQTVLVVDDDATIRALVAAILESFGFGVIQAGDGVEGLARFSDYFAEVALVLSDVMMPNMTGPEMVREICKLNPSVRLLFMTGNAAAAQFPEGLRGHAVLEKPFTPDVLRRTVQHCLASSD